MGCPQRLDQQVLPSSAVPCKWPLPAGKKLLCLLWVIVYFKTYNIIFFRKQHILKKDLLKNK